MARILFVVLVLIWSLPALAAEPASSNRKPRRIKIGFVLPLSGEWAFLGAGIRDGARLAEKDLNAKGAAVALIFEDNHGDLAASATIARKLIDAENSDGIVSIISGVAKLIKPVTAKAKVLSIGICSDTEAADGQFSFVNYLTAGQGVSKYLAELQRTGKRNAPLGIYSLNEAGFLKIIDELKKQSLGSPQLQFIETFDQGTTDFRPLLLRGKQSKAKTLLILGLSPEIELLVRQARALGISTPVTSIEGFGLASDKTAFEGSWFIDSGVPNLAFRERFNAIYGRDVTPGVGHAYDSVLLIAKAFESANEPALREDAASNFRKIVNLDGVLGKLTVQPDGLVWSDASVKVIKNGEPQLLEQ